MNLNERIESNPKVMLGKPVIKGTRITVESIVRKLGEGASIEDLISSYNQLSKVDIEAALLFAAKSLSNEEVIFWEQKA